MQAFIPTSLLGHGVIRESLWWLLRRVLPVSRESGVSFPGFAQAAAIESGSVALQSPGVWPSARHNFCNSARQPEIAPCLGQALLPYYSRIPRRVVGQEIKSSGSAEVRSTFATFCTAIPVAVVMSTEQGRFARKEATRHASSRGRGR